MSLRRLGPSRDYRTSRWEVECPACGRRWEPATTMFAKEKLTCPGSKCARSMIADYDARTITLVQTHEEA